MQMNADVDDALNKSQLPQRRAALKEARTVLRGKFENGLHSSAFLRAHCKLIDSTLIATWKSVSFPHDLSLVAVGGFGHGSLFPHSDVDILVLLPVEPDQKLATKVEAFIGTLWDLGLEVGHSVRTVTQCLEEASRDITVRTAMLESRLITGSRNLVRSLRERALESFDNHTFLKAKQLEQAQRHAGHVEAGHQLAAFAVGHHHAGPLQLLAHRGEEQLLQRRPPRRLAEGVVGSVSRC